MNQVWLDHRRVTYGWVWPSNSMLLLPPSNYPSRRQTKRALQRLQWSQVKPNRKRNWQVGWVYWLEDGRNGWIIMVMGDDDGDRGIWCWQGDESDWMLIGFSYVLAEAFAGMPTHRVRWRRRRNHGRMTKDVFWSSPRSCTVWVWVQVRECESARVHTNRFYHKAHNYIENNNMIHTRYSYLKSH